jgi:copper chaperone
MSTTNYYVTGMKCDSCIKRANEALGEVPGFESAEFDLAEGVATVVGDVDPQSIAQTLTETGYPATVKSA